MTTNDYSARTTLILDTVHEHDHEHEHEMDHHHVPKTNENNLTVGVETIDLDRSQSPVRSNTDLTSKRSRIQAVFSSRPNANDKKTTSTVLANAVGVLSQSSSNTSGPGGGASPTNAGTNGFNHSVEQPNVVATLSQHASAAMPVATLALSPNRSSPVPSNNHSTTTTMTTAPAANTTSSTTSSAKQFLIRRVRSRSKSDPQSVPDKSLFSRFFPKKTKKPLATLLTTTTKSIDTPAHMSHEKKRSNLLTRNNLEEEFEEEEFDERIVSTGSLSDTDHQNSQLNRLTGTQSSNVTRAGSRTNSGNSRTTSAGPNALTLPTSDSQYYASMSAAPKGFSISYHKRMTNGSDDLRKQATLTRFQQQTKQNASGGTSQLLSLFQDPTRAGAQSPNHLASGTRISKTLSGQTIITRNSSSDGPSTYFIRPTSSSPTCDADETFVSDDEIYTHFMKNHTCYDIMPKSSKLVIFDTQLAVKKAFYALVYNGVRAAPLWDTKRQKFTGMLTITDFILILQKYYKEPNAKIEELEEHRIETWREVLREYEKPLLCIKPTDSLFEAVRILTENHVHRLPIVDPVSNNVIFILTHKRILRFFYLYIYDWPQPAFMSKTLEELNVGTYDDMHFIYEDTTVIEALNQFVKYRVSALPVVDHQRKLVNIYSKFDVIGLAADKTYTNLNMDIKEALSFRKERLETVAKCYKNESLAVCMERIVKAEVHRLVVVDQDEHVIGVLSLSDLLYYIVIRPTKTTVPPTIAVPTINISNEDGQIETPVDHIE